MILWGVFKDHRGVAYCEPINQGIEVWVKHLPAVPEKRAFISGKVIREAREASRDLRAVFLETHYSRKDYVETAFEQPRAEGWNYDAETRYMVENRWGPVKILVFITDFKLGRRMQYEFRRIAPEREIYDLGRRGPVKKSWAPRDDTDFIIEVLKRL